MIDYNAIYTFWLGDVNISNNTVITIQEGYIKDQELLEDVILEILKEQVDEYGIEIVSFEEVTKNVNLYRFEDNDVYFE